jgi:hypothetical protein
VSAKPKVWRALDWGGLLVEIEYPTHRVCCPGAWRSHCCRALGLPREQLYQRV